MQPPAALLLFIGTGPSLAIAAERDLLFASTPRDKTKIRQHHNNIHHGFGGADGVSSSDVMLYGATFATGTETLTLPDLTVQHCTSAGGCVAKVVYVSIDQNWLWYTDNSSGGSANSCSPSTNTCPDGDCATCKLAQPTSYQETYGITTTGDALTLPFLYKGPYSSVLGSRVYLLDGNTPDSNYNMFSMLNQEISFDVDMTKMGCGFNGAVYFVEIAADGGMSTGTQGPAYGTGYCDAQCPSDGVTTPTGNPNLDSTAVCCNEMDLFEANQAAATFTPHPCLRPGGAAMVGPYVCGTATSAACESLANTGVCDGAGCDFNSYRLGDTTYYGEGSGYTVDSTQKITVTTQFHAANGMLSSIVQLYTVNGAVYKKSEVTVNGEEHNNITTGYCAAEYDAFNPGAADPASTFASQGGLTTIGGSLDRGMVLVLSLWNSTDSMAWLDGTTSSGPGGARGPCGTAPQDASVGVGNTADTATVTYSNIKWGDIDSTYDPSSIGPPRPPAPPAAEASPPSPPPSNCAAAIAMCATGNSVAWNASPKCCVSGYVCCDNGQEAYQYASCQTQSYCTGGSCKHSTDGSPCTIAN